MSEAVKMPLIKIEISEGKKTKLYLVPKSAANAVATLLDGLDESEEGSIPAEDIFPDLKDLSKHPMITFRGTDFVNVTCQYILQAKEVF